MCAYCTVQDMRNLFQENIQIGDNNIGTPVPGRLGSGSTRSNLSPAQAQYYINYASQYIDSRLRPFYSCPLRLTKSYETVVQNNLLAGSSVTVKAESSGAFIEHALVRIQDKDNMELATVEDVTDLTTLVIDTLVNSYNADGRLLISIVEFPDPIPLMAAQLACATFMDKLWTAEQSPDVSNYAKSLRNMATFSMDSILTGEISLFGQEHTGRRFVRGSVFDAYKSPAEVNKGEEKE